MIVLVVIGLAVVLLGFYAKRLLDKQAAFFRDRLEQQDKAEEGRRQALYQQQKASQTVIAQQQRAGEILANQTRALHEDARLTLQRVDGHFAHPAVKRLVNEGGD